MTSFDQMNLIKARLNSLRQRDTHFQIFGAHQHRYQLNPALTPKEVADFEQKHAIVLPEDYRSFLLFLGNGGAGPYYGLFPLQRYSWELDDVHDTFLSLAFPHQRPWRPDPDALDKEALAEQYTYFGNYWVQGSMRVCHYGCGVYFLLVVSGPERGNIWVDDRVSDNGIYPCGRTFSTWYETWLEESLQKLEQKKAGL